MHRFVALALVAFGGSPFSVLAQDAPASNYAFCTVTDTGRTPAQIWASPVFEFNAPAFDVEALNRVAGEFLQHVSGLGGAGSKNCIALATRAEAEAFRQEQRSIWDRKMYFVKVGHWRDVAWTPPPLAAAPMAATVPRWFRCYATQTDVPGRYARAITVSSGVFEQPVPGERAFAAAMEQAQAYGKEFGQVAQANGIPAELAACAGYDTRPEADKAERDYRDMIGGFNTRYTVMAWMPDRIGMAATVPHYFRCRAVVTDTGFVTWMVSSGVFQQPVPGDQPVAAGKAQAIAYQEEFRKVAPTMGLPIPDGNTICTAYDTAGEAARAEQEDAKNYSVYNTRYTLAAWTPGGSQAMPPASGVAPPAASASAAPTPATVVAVPQSLYCVAFLEGIARLRAPVRELRGTSHAALAASLGRWTVAAQAAYPGNWSKRLDKIGCFEDSATFAGETLCFGTDRIKGKVQMAGLFCNASRALIDKRVDDMDKNDGGTSQSFEWPPES